MSCDAVAFTAFLWLASTGPAHAPRPLVPIVAAPTSVAGEPLFADIIRRAGDLRLQVAALRKAGPGPLPGFASFQDQVAQLSDLDMKGHVLLKERGTDGDLKCILRGISQDLPLKLKDVADAADPKARDTALRDLDYLLRDNVEVITAPPAPPV
jgi:hypothetical protein